MNDKQIYRLAALNARQLTHLGNIVLIYPLTFRFLTAISAVFVSLLVMFLVVGTYTAHTTVTGLLIPDHGLIKIYAPQPGVVVEKHVFEGQLVHKGDVLYVLSGERRSAHGETQTNISGQIQSRRQSLLDEVDKTKHLQHDEIDILKNRIVTLSQEMQKLDSQISTLESRVKFAEDSVNRYQSLQQKNFVSKDVTLQKEADLLDQKQRLQVVQRDRIRVEREFRAEQSTLQNLPLKHQNQLSEIWRTIASTEQEYAESEAKRSLVVTASQTGVATIILAEIGQTVDTGHMLVSIVPENSLLQASLLVPSKAIGFIDIGTPVVLRYQAYPYQKFGHAKGFVVSISQSAIPVNEVFNSNAKVADDQPLYRVTVSLPRQFVKVNGKSLPLQIGMALDADILQETRHLYEWTLDPLYSLSGKR